MVKSAVQDPQSLLEAVRYFSDPELAFNFIRDIRWPDGQVVCPHCSATEHSFLTSRKIWKCKGCKRQFSLKVGTIWEDSPIGFEKWLPAMWLLANSKNSVSSHELARALSVTQKTAWFMFHRIRLAMEAQSFEKLSGTVEVDETYVGGDAVNMHMWKRKTQVRHGYAHKTPVQGARERETGTVKADVISGGNLRANVREWVEPNATVFTDEASGYKRLTEDGFDHKTVTHGRREYVSGIVHTNGIENFWALLKRSIKGSQTHVDREHLGRYVTERQFAYNYRDSNDLGRMKLAVKGVDGRRVTWNDLTGKPS
jgi:transposase-like protein